MNKAQLIEAVANNLGTNTKAEATRATEAVLGALAHGIKKSKLVQMVGFGTFKVTVRKARKGINPKTGEKIKIKASKSVKFTPSKALKESL